MFSQLLRHEQYGFRKIMYFNNDKTKLSLRKIGSTRYTCANAVLHFFREIHPAYQYNQYMQFSKKNSLSRWTRVPPMATSIPHIEPLYHTNRHQLPRLCLQSILQIEPSPEFSVRPPWRWLSFWLRFLLDT